MIERLYNPFKIGTAILAVGPKSQELIEFTNLNQDRINAGTSSWIKKPYLHEYALAKAYFGIAARDGILDTDYVENLITVFGWILELDRDKFRGEVRMNDRVAPLFFNDEDLMDIKRQHLRLQRKDFFTNFKMIMGLKMYFGVCARMMVYTGILRMDTSSPGDLIAA